MSSNAATKIKQISVDKAVPEKALQQAAEQLKMHEIVCDDNQTAEVLKYYHCINPFSAKDVLIDFTLSNARQFYSSKGNPLALKGLIV